MSVLFVANGHGETAIAARIGAEVAAAATTRPVELDLLPLVGEGAAAAPLRCVGPRRTMPSGGLVAMGNVRAFARDLGAGFLSLFARQLAFVSAAGPRYRAVVAVGDVYALAVALLARRPTLFVGTAKSVFVAPYGPCERVLLRRAAAGIFVRDEATAARLRAQRVPASAPGNVIVDLVRDGPPPPGAWLGLLPGSREAAYGDAVRLARVVRALGERQEVGVLLSIAPTLEMRRFARGLEADGWSVRERPEDAPFEARAGRTRLLAWNGDLGSLLRASTAVLGQAGTANEQAAAFGIPVVALQESSARIDWYRMRQRRLLGDALILVSPEPEAAADALAALLRDPARLRAMSEAGRERMGPAGGARVVARAILDAVS